MLKEKNPVVVNESLWRATDLAFDAQTSHGSSEARRAVMSKVTEALDLLDEVDPTVLGVVGLEKRVLEVRLCLEHFATYIGSTGEFDGAVKALPYATCDLRKALPSRPERH